MNFNFERLFAVILEVASADDSFTNRMVRVIDECAAQQPHADWELFRELSYDEDHSRLSPWLSRAFGQGWTHTECKGIWFGLVQVERGGEVVADVYASAASQFDPESIEWAYEVHRNDGAAYLDSPVLAAIYRLAYGRHGGLANAAEYPLALAYGALAGRAALEAAPLPSPLLSLQGAAVGYDDGDLLFLGKFVEGKFVSQPREG